MKVIFHNPASGLYVVQGEVDVPVLLANIDCFDNDSHNIKQDPLFEQLCALDEDHYIVAEHGKYFYIAKREGVTVTYAQWLRTDDHEFGNRYLAEALEAVRAYDGAGK